ncbi:AAA family ATPase [Caballeronia sp. KNU42]
MKRSFIESLTVRDFRQFDDLRVEFNSGFNFIAGPNGSGKTSILASIAHCLTHTSIEHSRVSETSEIFVDVNHKGDLMRVGLGKGSFDGHGYRTSRAKTWAVLPETEGRKNVLSINTEKEAPDFAPLLLGAQRSLHYMATQGMQREGLLVERRKKYRSESVANVFEGSGSNVKQWLINRYFIVDKDWAGTQKKNWQNFLNALPALAPFDSEFRFERIKSDMEPVFSIYGRECYLEELSSGFQAVLTIVARIIEWAEGTGEGESAEIENALGSVLIDEIDIHLHPEWQFTLRDGLRQLFPNVQFIVTTHSPHVLASARECEVIAMPASVRGKCIISPSTHGYSGWTTDQILTEVMGVRSLDNKQYEILTQKAFDYVEQKNLDGLRLTIERLRAIAHPDDVIVKVLDVRLASLILTEND